MTTASPNVWVFSDEARVAETRSPVYEFAGARGRTSWPRDAGQGLASCGMWNFLWRLGFHPKLASATSAPSSAQHDVLFADLADSPSDAAIALLRQWSSAGGRLVLTGEPASCAIVMDRDARWERTRVDHPYAGLAYVSEGLSPQLIAPAGWSFATAPSSAGAPRHLRTLAVVGGERQTPQRAILTPLKEAPAMIVNGRSCFMNASPFAAFQSWLQGQEDLQPWMAWRHRLLWLDEWVSDVAGLLSSIDVLPLGATRPGIRGLDSTTVVLRHDLDDSRDTAYLDDEEARGIGATHAVLLDRSTRFWIDRLAKAPRQEAAFHYNTARVNWTATALTKWRGQSGAVVTPKVRDIAGAGLLRQVKRAKAAGIGVATLHRHFSFLPYPEWVDALDAVFAAEPQVLGGSSLFRGQMLRWGRDRVDGKVSTVGDWPDAQFPFWMPFRIAHAADGGRMLRGWETTSLMEPEPELVDQLLACRLPFIEQRVFTLGFHPAHASGSTFVAGGSRGTFRAVLRLLEEHHVQGRPLAEVLGLADRTRSI